tara:strand:+ start:12303 stop:14666 length:2364 start_codon:yes stop_codon:yes gene_type:complete
MSYWRADIQLDDMELKGTTGGDLDFDPHTTRLQGGSSNPHWIKNSSNNSSSLPSFSSGWTACTTTTSTSGRWNYDRGGTPSSATGGTRDSDGSTTGYYLYAESSSPNYGSGKYLWAAMAQDYTLSGSTSTTIGTVTISGPTSAQTGTSSAYTAAIGGNASSPVYTWALGSFSAGTISSSGNTATVNWSTAGSQSVICVVSDSAATDSPVTATKSVTVTAPATIGSVTISGPATANVGASYGPYTYTAAIGGTSSSPVYTWSIPSGGTLVSSSGNTGNFSFTSAGSRTVQVVVSDSSASDSPVTQTKSVSVSVGTLYLGTPTVTGNAGPVISTQETYTVGNITDAAVLTDETYSWSITGTGGTSGGSALQSSGAISINDLATEFGGSAPHALNEYFKGGTLVPNISINSGVPTSGVISLDDFYGAAAAAPISFTGQGTTSITLTWPSSTGTYSVGCVVTSATATDSPKTATLAISTVASTNIITSPTLGSRITGGWTSVGDGVGELNLDRASFIVGKVYDVTITTGSASWHSSASNFRDSTPHGMGISDNHNNIANGPNQSRDKRIVLRGDTNYYSSFVTATGVSDYYGVELHAWVIPGQSSSAGYIYRNFYDTSSYNTRSGNNPTVTAYSGSQTYTSTPHELGTTIAVTINRAAGGWSTNYVGQALNFTAATSGWVLLNAIFRKGTGNWTASQDYFYFKVIEIQSNGNTDVEMIHSILNSPSNSTSQYVASQWVHFDSGNDYRVYAYFSNGYNTASSTWGPHYIDIRSGNASTGPLWHTYTCQVIVS